jgi:hypothetical protein
LRRLARLRSSGFSGSAALLALAAGIVLGSCGVASGQSAPAAQPAAQTQPAAAQAQPAPAPAAAAPAAPAPTAPGTVTYSGLVDVYYGFNFNHPVSGQLPATLGDIHPYSNNGYSFNYHNNFGLNNAEINVSRTAGRGFPLGVTATIAFGDTPSVVYANEPHPTQGLQSLEQLFFTYTPHVAGRDIAIDFGKFFTPFGYEVIESSNNDNYTRGFLFTYAIPLYHAGLRITSPIDSKLTVEGMIVNGWNNVTDDNNAKSVQLGLTWKPTGKITAIANWMGGAEGTGAYGKGVPPNGQGDVTTNIGEAQAIYQATPKLKFALDTVLGNGAGGISGTHVSGNWFALAGYGHYQITNQFAAAVRLEQFEDQAGAGGVGLRLGMPGYTRLRDATVTLEYTSFRGKLVHRVEYRRDGASSPFYFAGGAGRFAQSQDTLFFAEVFKF